MDRRRALIVGAGIGGLAAGVALHRAGWHVRIFERASSPRELGFALNLAPNAIVALRQLGLAEQLITEGSVIADVEVRHADGSVSFSRMLVDRLARNPPVQPPRGVCTRRSPCQI